MLSELQPASALLFVFSEFETQKKKKESFRVFYSEVGAQNADFRVKNIDDGILNTEIEAKSTGFRVQNTGTGVKSFSNGVPNTDFGAKSMETGIPNPEFREIKEKNESTFTQMASAKKTSSLFRMIFQCRFRNRPFRY